MAKAKPEKKPKKKAMTGAERQAAYRQRRKGSRYGSMNCIDDWELRTWITMGAFLALARQARHYGVTKRKMLEQLIDAGEDKTYHEIKGTPAQKAYWKVFPPTKR